MSGSGEGATSRYDAVVLGASTAGLLSALVLAQSSLRVALVERDELPSDAGARRGVPQSHHPHILLARGRAVLDELLPGFPAALDAAGAVTFDSGSELMFWGPAGRGRPVRSGLMMLSATRGLLDQCLRDRVLAYPGISLLAQTTASRLRAERGQAGTPGVRVCGVSVRADGGEGDIDAGLVVDATGRASRAPVWLREIGVAPATEVVVDPRQGYASRLYRPPPHWSADWVAAYVPPTPPGCRRGAVLLPVEGGRWLVGLTGRGDDQPPQDPGYLDFARSLPTPIVADALAAATPVSDIRPSRATANRWIRYDEMAHPPSGFAVVGDAACTFNPIYGQGMSAAALGALSLRDALAIVGGQVDSPRLPGLVAGGVARAVAAPWLLAVGQDARFPQTVGGRQGPTDRLVGAYLDRLTWLAAEDAVVRMAQLQVFHLLRPPSMLFHPRLLMRAARPLSR